VTAVGGLTVLTIALNCQYRHPRLRREPIPLRNQPVRSHPGLSFGDRAVKWQLGLTDAEVLGHLFCLPDKPGVGGLGLRFVA
jgi:hypothetical protein